MKKLILGLFPALLLTALLAGCQPTTPPVGTGGETQTTEVTTTQTQTEETQATQPGETQTQTQSTIGLTTWTIDKVKLYMVALDDGGKLGTKFGCNDSLVAVDKKITPVKVPPFPVKTALQDLFAIKTQKYDLTSLYNSLYQSSLKVDKTEIKDGKLLVTLSGTTKLGGVCDDPRFYQQIQATASQFVPTQTVEITLNGKPLSDVLSEK